MTAAYSRKHKQLRELLEGCSLMELGFWHRMLPHLRSGKVYGFLDIETEELGHQMNLSIKQVECFLAALHRRHVLRISGNGMYYCPHLWKE